MTLEFDLFGPLSPEEEATLNIHRCQIQYPNKSNRAHFLTIRKKQLPFFRFNVKEVEFLELQSIVESEVSKRSFETARHSAFRTTDYSFASDSKVYEICSDLILKVLENRWGFWNGELELLDLFLVVYSFDGQRKLEPHSDGCLISFNIQMNDPNDFGGGGTLFVESKNLVKLQRGECLAHDSKLLHSGKEITFGTRKILVGFVETKKEAQIKRKLMTMSQKRSEYEK